MRLLIILFFTSVGQSYANTPDEYQAYGGHSLGLDNGGSVATGGVAAVRLNPAMLPMEKEYSLAAGYHWPTSGREFMQVGVVDSTTSDVAAGVNMTSYREDYRDEVENFEDSPIQRRIAFAFAKSMRKVAIGLSGQYIDGQLVDEFDEKRKGFTYGGGVAGLLTPTIRFGVSAENLANRKVADMAPMTYRGGMAWLGFNGNISLHGDLVQTQKIFLFEGDSLDIVETSEEADEVSQWSRKFIVSGVARFQDFLRFMIGTSTPGDDRSKRSVGGGIALVNDKVALSVTARRPDLEVDDLHQNVHLSLRMAF